MNRREQLVRLDIGVFVATAGVMLAIPATVVPLTYAGLGDPPLLAGIAAPLVAFAAVLLGVRIIVGPEWRR